MIVDKFAGPGGWDQGLAMIGRRDVIGIEWDKAACATALAAGHARLRGDVRVMLDGFRGLPIEGVIASPPCQAWSMAGNRKGELDRANCHRLADRMADGDDSTDWTSWEDERSSLVCEPVRWVRELRPEWVAFEEVPAVASLWEHFARIFRRWGYSVWTGDLLAADYGVPQTRRRRILMASRVRKVAPPEPTHAKEPATDLFGGETLPWVSMADALGWDPTDMVRAHDRGSGMIARHGDRPDTPASEPSPTIISNTGSWLRASNQANAAVRGPHEPAPTLVFGTSSNDLRFYPDEASAQPGRAITAADRPENRPDWAYERPATTVVGRFVLAGRDRRARLPNRGEPTERARVGPRVHP